MSVLNLVAKAKGVAIQMVGPFPQSPLAQQNLGLTLLQSANWLILPHVI